MRIGSTIRPVDKSDEDQKATVKSEEEMGTASSATPYSSIEEGQGQPVRKEVLPGGGKLGETKKKEVPITEKATESVPPQSVAPTKNEEPEWWEPQPGPHGPPDYEGSMVKKTIERLEKLDKSLGEYFAKVEKNIIETNVESGAIIATGIRSFIGNQSAKELMKMTDSLTLKTWIKSGLKGAKMGISTFPVAETFATALLTSLYHWALLTFSYETGVAIGSLISSAPVYGSEKTIGQWWGDKTGEAIERIQNTPLVEFKIDDGFNMFESR